MTKTTLTPAEWKERGNEAFNKGDFDEALHCYTSAIKLTKEDNFDKQVYLKNRAAVHLKKENYQDVVKDCDAALKIAPKDPKALFRRCQAFEAMQRFEEAYRDAQFVISVDPGNKAIRPILCRLHEIVQERLRQNSRVDTKVKTEGILEFDFYGSL